MKFNHRGAQKKSRQGNLTHQSMPPAKLTKSVQTQLRIVTDDDTVLSEDVIACFDKGDDQLEEIGLSLEQAKTMLASAQTSLVAAQAAGATHEAIKVLK